MGDGKAKYFSGDDFYRLCEEDEEKRLEETQEKERRGVERQEFAQKIAMWQDANEAIRAQNVEKRDKFAVDVVAWKAEKAAAKAEKWWTGWPRPKLMDYVVEKLLPRSKKWRRPSQKTRMRTRTRRWPAAMGVKM
jgi:hypothetical protein